MRGQLEVIEPGLLTTVQDVGRPGGRELGVARGGVLDREAMRLVNALAGNPPAAAVLELTHLGPVLQAGRAPVTVAIGDCPAAHLERGEQAVALDPWTVLTLQPGDRLRSGRVGPQLRTCLAVGGGVDLPPVLGSRSTDLRAGFGGLEGRPLQRGDVLHAGGPAPRTVRRSANVHLPVPEELRICRGPEGRGAGWRALLQAELAVSSQSDRVGMRLDGERLPAPSPREIASAGCLPGMLQLPAGGQPIVLLADAGTTGGYARLAMVASADLSGLARLRPGAPLRLVEVSPAEAVQARRSREAELVALEERLREA